MSVFNLYYQTSTGSVLKCARIQLNENARGQLESVYFSYHPDFLDSDEQPIDPRLLPKSSNVVELTCDREAPGFIDDVLPDDWGKKVLARVNNLTHKPCISELLELMNHSTVGALYFIAENDEQTADYGLGCEKSNLEELHSIASKIDSGLVKSEEIERIKLNMFSRGSSVGGARPKVLVHDEQHGYIAKFSKQSDEFNYAMVENACLSLMRQAGIMVADTHVETIQHQQVSNDVLFVRRFDVSEQGGRYHQLTANALLKSLDNQTDPLLMKYDHISDLICRYSAFPERDNQQLFAQMLFNKVLNNTDDHLRNFSFTCREDGWQLSSAYDVVPSLAHGQYHQLKVGLSDYLPELSEAVSVHKKFNLTKQVAQDVIERVSDVSQNWKTVFAQLGVSEEDLALLQNVIRP
ncbi:type II toxin-antitoxin system HipA family toxin [Paraneptunicella aestuarii]|uniref:type II toxin-antitoxin system HipA family toxin n=1 Tax=Paraneptunicella aestuarii TaxID=2831148 RepID=UPI001E61FC8A|nr:type II toxin-antitoxin system HipA family toxin [Paraneptunicella aestuarii]UAA39782.1 type II toxin-antitoxin system HipA family toxin [Paraneptunicella aestuarii]